MIRHLLHCLSITLLVLSLSAEFTEAGTTGKIKGNVTDSDTGEPLVGANVVLVGSGLGAATDNEGNFFILNVPPGNYRVRASVIGYQSVEMTAVRVNVDLTTKVDFTLSTQAIEAGEVITVIASRPLIQRDGTATAAVITAEEIANAPIETIQDIVLTKAGVSVDAFGLLHIRGGRADEIAYIIDGVLNRDPFNNSQAIELATNSVQEISVISGSFNAEYGQALSGVINMVTKEGGRSYNGSISYQMGDLVSEYDIDVNKAIRDEVGNYDLSNLRELEASIGGPLPLPGGNSSFFVSGRLFQRGATLYGLQVFDPLGAILDTTYLHLLSAERQSNLPLDPADVGDAALVEMNPLDKINIQAKLSYSITQTMKLQYTLARQDNEWQSYTHSRKFSPTGRLNNFEKGNNNILKLTHQVSNKTFYTIIGSLSGNTTESYAFSDPFDPRYVWSGYNIPDVNAEFRVGGTSNLRSARKFETQKFKIDFSTQFNKQNELKFGFEYNQHSFSSKEVTVLPDRLAEPFTDLNGNGVYDVGEPFIDLFNPAENVWDDADDSNNDDITGNIILGSGNALRELATKPVEYSFYLQDKVELEDMIINLGLRLDSFDPDAFVANNWNNPDPADVKPATVKTQISPRFSLAYPITDRGKLYFSYGHFFQLPPYKNLYQNQEFDILPGLIKSDIGNADLEPQKTVSYELGFEQQLAEDVAAYVRLFFKDYRNLLGQRRYITPTSREFTLFINRDYGDVKGLSLTLNKRFSNSFSSSVDYTYQIAQGNESDPTETRRDYRLNIEQEKQVIFLAWDQTHALRFNSMISKPGVWGVGVIGRIESGYPYTPTTANELVRVAEENSGRKKAIADFDFTAYKSFRFTVGERNLTWSVKAKIYNLFNRKNENFVWDSTGSATYSLGRFGGLNTPAWENRPHWFARPRTLYLGASLDF